MYVEIVTTDADDEGTLYKTLLEDMKEETKSRKLAIDFMPGIGAAVCFDTKDPKLGTINERGLLLQFGTKALKTAKIKGESRIVDSDLFAWYNEVPAWVMM